MVEWSDKATTEKRSCCIIMNSLEDIWGCILENMEEKLTATSINAWFSQCVPLELYENKFVLVAPSDFVRGLINNRFSPTIKTILSDLFSCDFELVVLVEDEVQEYQNRKNSDDALPEMAGFTFDRFVVGPSNKYAHAAALGVAENPGTKYNPLFIYGNSGLGKTHLLMAIGQQIRDNNPGAKIAYVKGDEFTNQMVHSIQAGTAEEFRKKYRNVDLFLVDDIQFIAGKESTQEEFFHTFNNIYEAGHQIVITSDRPPIDMLKLDDRLRTRFEGGLMADVQPPDMETRMAITRNKAGQLGMILPDDVVEYIADNITANIRQLEGVVKRLTAYKEILDDTITVNSVKRAIKDVIRIGTYIPTPDIIIEETARYYGLTDSDLRGQRRSKTTAMARQVSMYLIRSLTNMSLVDIGKEYEDRNHSTVLTSIRKVEDQLKTDKEMAGTIRDITSNINSRN